MVFLFEVQELPANLGDAAGSMAFRFSGQTLQNQ